MLVSYSVNLIVAPDAHLNLISLVATVQLIAKYAKSFGLKEENRFVCCWAHVNRLPTR